MSNFSQTSPFASNPLRSRSDVTSMFTALLDALAPHTSPGGARIHLGHTATHFDEVAAQLEGFSRPIWGLASLLAGSQNYQGSERWTEGYASGTNPKGDEFWGNMRDKDQRMVECSAIGYSLAVAREYFWDPLSDEAKDNLGEWLGGMNDKQMPNTNWLWFRVFANLGLSKVGSKHADVKRMKADLDHLDTFYIGDGWSRDGPEGVVQLDYYSSSFAIQVAQLLYSKLAQNEDPKRCEEFRNRARKFALDFVYYFDAEGRAIPFGRSLTYRCAMSAFWSAFAVAFTPTSALPDLTLPEPFTWGIVKGLQLRNIRYWAKQAGAFTPSGVLTLGYVYPNHNILENYNSPGSPYWACNAFICLSLPETHPFWTSPEEPYPSTFTNTVKVLKHPLHIISSLHTEVGSHTFILSSGQQCSYPVKQGAAKYGKFTYSSAFGYCVPTSGVGAHGRGTLEEVGELGHDGALAVSDDNGETWRVRRDTRQARFEPYEYREGGEIKKGEYLRSTWFPWPDVEVETFLIPPTRDASLWHLRVHRVNSGRELWTAEGSWAVYGQREDGRHLDPVFESSSEACGTYEGGREARATSRAGVVGIIDLSPSTERKGIALRADANTSLIYARSVLPTLQGHHQNVKKDTWLVTAVFGLPATLNVETGEETGAKEGWKKEWMKRLEVPEFLESMIRAN
ncbi:hypothetical protein E1B28_012789 [Marasmius oreades]|uniref:Uncharacterized protein n=1 Tax=Marasmius oreades TaxID=181124 RepID=A0A9P7UR58_9AGAR|nr:uncharacterized protein E1B28_012789 [Marasmius oreades]KAG7088834.1 hypothetical protein E1B28_012789 [Marasmius oreades]